MQNEQITSTTSSFNTLAFIDLETTGLPSQESRPKITELSIVACSVEHIMGLKEKNEIPRVLHKLSVCFNPAKMIKLRSSEITGLSNELLEREKKFDENTVDFITNFLSHLQQPVCLVAHNGFSFDYPILKSQCASLNKTLPDSLICCDSLKIFRKIDEIYEENSRTLINGYKLTSWEKIQTQNVLLMDAEILEIEQIVKNYSSDDESDVRSSLTVTQLETDFLQHNHVEAIKDEPKDEQNNVDEIKIRQQMNETTPNKPVRNDEKKPPSKNTENNNKRPMRSPRRELFPDTSEEKSSPSNNETVTKKKVYPRGYYTLGEIYKRFFEKDPEKSHYAESDVIALMKCVCATKKEFLDVAKKTAINFNEVKEL